MLNYYLEQKKASYDDARAPSANYATLEAALIAVRRRFGSDRIGDVSRQSIRDFTQERRREGAANGTIRKELTIFRASLNMCHKEGLFDQPVVSFELPPEPPPRQYWLTSEQVKLFMQADAYPHVDLFCLLALHTLSRKGAILDLRWSWGVNFERNLINFNPPGRIETKKRRVAVPMSSRLRASLEEAREFALTDFVVEFNGRQVQDIKRGFASKAAAAGMEWITPHVLRHTGASLLAQKGAPMQEIAQIMGDDIRTVEKHYVKFSPDYLKAATSTLEQIYG